MDLPFAGRQFLRHLVKTTRLVPHSMQMRIKNTVVRSHLSSSFPEHQNMQLTRSSSSFQSLILYSEPFYELKQTHLHSLDFDASYSCHLPVKLNVPFQVPNTFTVVGSCNGLLCIEECSSSDCPDIYIYNPSTSDYSLLPRVNRPTVHIGFGFDPKSGKCKVVRILNMVSILAMSFFPAKLMVDVFTVGESTWKSRDEEDALFVIDLGPTGVYVNGAIHWKGHKIDGNRIYDCIVCYDLGSDEVRILPFSDPSEEATNMSLMALGDCLASYGTFNSEIVIWVMKDDGVKKSWTRQYIIQDLAVVKSGIEKVKPLCFNENGEIVLICGGKQFVAYDPVKKSCRDLGFQDTLELVSAVPHLGSIIPATM